MPKRKYRKPAPATATRRPSATPELSPYAQIVPPAGAAGLLRAANEVALDRDAIAAFLGWGLACGDIAADAPVWIVDLAPGNGERAWRLLQALDGHHPELRYLACCAHPDHAAALRAHPALRPWLAKAQLVLADGDAATAPPALRNPCIVLAHGAFATRRQGLYAVHYGELLEAWVAPATPASTATIAEWRALPTPADTDSLLACYRHTLNSAPFTLPLGALEILEAQLAASQGRMLLVASDFGALDLVQIRLGALLPATLTEAAPVNFNALAQWHSRRGAWVHQAQNDDGERVLHLAIHDHDSGRLLQCGAALGALAHPDTAVHLLAALPPPHPSAAQCLALLAAVGYDARALPALAVALRGATTEVCGRALRAWRTLLAQLWAGYFPTPDNADIALFIATLAVNLEDWPLARSILRDALHAGPAQALHWRLLAQCQVRTGGARAAALSLAQARRLDAAGGESAAEHAALDRRLAAWPHRAYHPDLAREAELVVEPLDATHAADLLYQYRDPQIGLMTRLPALTDLAQTQDWLADRVAQSQRTDLAVMHANRGFIGVVSAHWHDDGAFVHFWLGTDHQGCGFGPRAARLLLTQLGAQGITQAFTAIYPDNTRSLHTLQRLGFQRLPLRAQAPEEEMVFLGWSAAATPLPARCDALRRFSRQTGSVFVFADPTRQRDTQDAEALAA